MENFTNGAECGAKLKSLFETYNKSLSVINSFSSLPKKNNNLHLTINNHSKTSVSTNQWIIKGESERVAVRFQGKEYVIVLSSPPYYEEWTLDEQGELKDLERTIF